MADINYMTKEGFDKLKKEIEHLKSVERPRISQQIAEARDKGDLSENAEYDAAKEAQGLMELKISKLEETLANSRIIDPSKMQTDKVGILSKVKVYNHKMKNEVVYTIVSEKEANLKELKISVKSPIGKALMGHAVGDIVEVQIPAGILKLEVKEISV